MKFTLYRFANNVKNNNLFGKIIVENGKKEEFCYSVENFKKCIPLGVYRINLTYSDKFGRYLPELVVSERTGIRIHTGNTAKDVNGCIALGTRMNDTQIYNSKEAFNNFMDLLLREIINNPKEQNLIEITTI